MYKLFGAEGSGSAAIEIALKYCDVDYQLVTASSWLAGEGSDVLKQLNPLTQVPTLVTDDGTVLTESAAIMIFLGLEFPSSGLLSRNHIERSQQLRSLVYIAANCYSPIGIIDYPERWLPTSAEEHLNLLKVGAKLRLYDHWNKFSDLFGSTAFWHPESPCAPEILTSVVTRWSGTREYLSASRPDFYDSLLLIDCQPIVCSVNQRHWCTDESVKAL
ncbi:glutathione S-transferase [Pseudomonas asuensis]|uniref:Glutathione S-transferase n=1 Tax=Pseudomonas asuensis TaxID=1825787 RepID=A0ABQ2GYF5_9PSED|nr:glutathione S-transferase [Pseudomonas asuensis]GGM20060.1 glutathione S-transferase [Pseudomonas asuensis]